MTRKILAVVVAGTCEKCPYVVEDGPMVAFCNHPQVASMIVGSSVEGWRAIPDWCPLPDAPKEEQR